MENNFKGYSPEIKKFFSDLKDNNNKDWFAEHKPFYEKEIKDVSKSLLQDMAKRFAEKGMSYVADEKKSLFRINRDIRFSNNKDPYKTNTGIYFPFSLAHASVKDPESLGLYLHIDYNEVFVAGGLHMPDSNALLLIRQRIAEDWKELEKIMKAKEFVKEFPRELFGEKLKRIPRGFSEDHPAAEWLKLKEYTVWCDLDFKTISQPGLTEIIERKAVVITPFLEFFKDALNG